MTTLLTPPEAQQTITGVTKVYRLFDHTQLNFGDLENPPATVVIGNWGVSYSETYGEDDVVLNAYRFAPGTSEFFYHPLNGTRYDTRNDARRAAFEAGLTAFMVYDVPYLAHHWSTEKVMAQCASSS